VRPLGAVIPIVATINGGIILLLVTSRGLNNHTILHSTCSKVGRN